jgi:hypothetical protein
VADEHARRAAPATHPGERDGADPGRGGNLDSPGDGTYYEFESGTFTEIVRLSHTPATSLGMPSPAGMAGNGHAFIVTGVYSDTGQPTEPGLPYTLTITYSEAEARLTVNGTSGLWWWDGNGWSQAGIENADDPLKRQVSAQVTHFSAFAVRGETKRVYLPFIQH